MSDIHTLPWPFPAQDSTFRYSVNVEPAPQTTRTAAGQWGTHVFDLGADYQYQMALRHQILAADPGRFCALPHMQTASWDYLLWAMRRLAEAYPQYMSLDGAHSSYRWRNTLLGVDQRFVFADDQSLPEHPLLYIAKQIPDDVLLLDERDGQLWFDAAVVTSSADWSVKFDLGMSFDEIHRPVPTLASSGVAGRAQSFMQRLTPDQIFRRVNWTFSAVGSRMRDTSLETMPLWKHSMPELIEREAWGQVQLRIELEHLTRLPISGALVFNIRTYMAPLSDIARYPAWAHQLADIVTELPIEIAQYKGIDDFRFAAMEWLTAQARCHEARRELAAAATSI